MNGQPSRGAALLIVLATLVILATATTILASSASWIQSRAHIDRCSVFAHDFLSAAEAPIQEWLSNQSSKVVLPPDASQPAIEILNDRLDLNELTYELRITAWDQCGMVPFELARNGSPLRQAVPLDVLDLIDAVQITTQDQFGLDQLIQTDSQLTDELSIYPSLQEPAYVAIGAMIATHDTDPLRINVNTATRWLLEHALRAANRGGLEQIIRSRSDGKAATVGGEVTRGRGGVEPELVPQLVSTSDRWSFRIEVSVGPVRKSWWAVYGPNAGSTKSVNQYKWKCVQRLVISH